MARAGPFTRDRTRRCTARSCGPCGCSPGSARPRTRTSASGSCFGQEAAACRWRSTSPPSWGATPTTLTARERWPLRRGGGHLGRRRGPVRRHRPGCHHHVDDDQFAGLHPSGHVREGGRESWNRPPCLGGTLQNDMLKEYQAQKEYIFPPRPSMRIVVDVIRFCAAEMPRFTRCRSPVTTSAKQARPPPRSWPSPWPTASPMWRPPSPRASPSTISPPAQLLLQRPSRFLRGDRQVPRRPSYLGALDGGPLRGRRRSVAATALPTPRPPVSPSRPSNRR